MQGNNEASEMKCGKKYVIFERREPCGENIVHLVPFKGIELDYVARTLYIMGSGETVVYSSCERAVDVFRRLLKGLIDVSTTFIDLTENNCLINCIMDKPIE